MRKQILIRLPVELHQNIKEKAAQDNRSMNSLIVFLLESCLPHFEPAKVTDEKKEEIENVSQKRN